MSEKLIEILKRYSLDDIVEIEESDRQFKALKKMFENMDNKEFFLPLIIANSLLSYQLSSVGEDYWEEFSESAMRYDFGDELILDKIRDFFLDFLPKSKGNKRLLNMKIPRIEKIMLFLYGFIGKQGYYYENLIVFREDLSKAMKQKKDDKTIVFSIKMFHYGARMKFGKFISVPFEIDIPVDSRILKITKIYNDTGLDTLDFWRHISKEVNIPLIHLDALLWIKCNDFICF
ncbi:MAG: N-glycosylase/DNA lyase [Candidatus Gracilibacteria bacterium]|nr:N-glycosylase/DNA lyase [Candidatus Gracilibacteria bacterium]